LMSVQGAILPVEVVAACAAYQDFSIAGSCLALLGAMVKIGLRFGSIASHTVGKLTNRHVRAVSLGTSPKPRQFRRVLLSKSPLGLGGVIFVC
jgi:hypothetical protein